MAHEPDITMKLTKEFIRLASQAHESKMLAIVDINASTMATNDATLLQSWLERNTDMLVEELRELTSKQRPDNTRANKQSSNQN